MYDLPPQVLRAISMLNAAGHRAYVVGGAVRSCCGEREPSPTLT